MKQDKHFPFLDKEFDILGLELFEIGVIVVVSLLSALLGFFIFPFLGIILPIFIMIGGFVYLKKKKSGKERGYWYRRYLKFSRTFKRIY